jgi:16S rRNA (guanine527-N7)-methyltransferase
VTEPDPLSLPALLLEALDQSRHWGFLGEGPLDVHVAHALGFAEAAEALGSTDGTWLDLGSGGGIPGLILANHWPDRPGILLDSNERRAHFLLEVVASLGWEDRVQVITERAEVAGRQLGLRGALSLVVARSFGAPPVTAECGAPFLRLGGALIVSDPPATGPADDLTEVRWPPEGLAQVGLERVGARRSIFGYQVLRQTRECPDRFPRRVGVPAKRPLYTVRTDRDG